MPTLLLPALKWELYRGLLQANCCPFNMAKHLQSVVFTILTIRYIIWCLCKGYYPILE